MLDVGSVDHRVVAGWGSLECCRNHVCTYKSSFYNSAVERGPICIQGVATEFVQVAEEKVFRLIPTN